jgi:transcription elongation factor B subunit 1
LLSQTLDCLELSTKSKSNTGGFSETREGEVRFPEISTPILEKICQYFYWSLHYSR